VWYPCEEAEDQGTDSQMEEGEEEMIGFYTAIAVAMIVFGWICTTAIKEMSK